MNNTRILFWNCQGVSRKRLELTQFVQEKKIDTLLLSETYLNSNPHQQFTTPTHYPNNVNHQPDILDIAIMKTGNLCYQMSNMTADLSSDYWPVIIEKVLNRKATDVEMLDSGRLL